MSRANELLRRAVNRINRYRLRNKDFSLIASNCNGALILHDLGLEFLTPTVNLWFKPKDFIRFVKELKSYLSCEICFSDEEEKQTGYPVGVLNGDVRVYFQHYETREDAKQKWVERGKRVNYENIFILFTDRDGCTQRDLEEFDKLPYKNKAVLTNRPHPEIKSAYYVKGFEKSDSVGMCYEFVNKLSGKKHYDVLPYVKWFNNEM